jgi:hypothetical protein
VLAAQVRRLTGEQVEAVFLGHGDTGERPQAQGIWLETVKLSAAKRGSARPLPLPIPRL